ncbi:hypothetical protein D621_07075 [beta proteobacterium AAP51]|nr:hypothetical protein D621_07075 [beta proteobacterium AAP51]
MPLTKSFERDIFISYCHADNEDPMGDGWVELFHKNLRVRLTQLLGARAAHEQPVIWRDISLQGNDEFAGVLAEELQKVALVISVLSPSYVRSEWCRREIDTFSAAARARGGMVVGANKGRILKVLKDEVPQDEHPEVLRGQIGFPFYVKDPDRQRPVPFTLTKGDDTIALAKKVIDDLARSIMDTVKALNELQPGPAQPAAAALATRPPPAESPAAASATAAAGTVYLAECEWDDERQQLRRSLEALGVTVLPAGELPLRRADDYKKAVREALAGCDVSVHLIAGRRSMVLGGEVQDTVSLQNELAAERSAQGGLKRLIWMPPGLQVAPDDVLQQAFVTRLQRDPLAQQGAELLSLPLQDLLGQVQDTLAQQVRARAKPRLAPREAGAPPKVYLIADEVDFEAADPLRHHLLDLGFDVVERLFDPDATPEELQADHRQNLVDCSAAVVFVGAVKETWVKTMLSEVQKADGWREPGRPLGTRVIYLAPPDNRYKSLYQRKQTFHTVDARQQPALQAVQALLQPEGAAGAGAV